MHILKFDDGLVKIIMLLRLFVSLIFSNLLRAVVCGLLKLSGDSKVVSRMIILYFKGKTKSF